MKATVLRHRVGEGHYVVKFVSVGKATDYDTKRKPLIWTFDGEMGILELVSGTRPTAGSVCGQLFWLLTGGEPGESADTDVAVGREFVADVKFDDEGRRTVKLRDEEAGREITITTNMSSVE